MIKFKRDIGVWSKQVKCPVMRCIFERISSSSNMMGSCQLGIKELCHSNAAVRHYVVFVCGCMRSHMQRRIRSIFCLCTICNETRHWYAQPVIIMSFTIFCRSSTQASPCVALRTATSTPRPLSELFFAPSSLADSKTWVYFFS